jgi:hypothetical protein
VSGGTGSEREGGKLTVAASMADVVELCTCEDERWVPFIGGKRSRALSASSQRQGGEDRGTRPTVGCVRHGRGQHGRGMAGGRHVAKRDFPCELVRRGGVGVGLSVPWPSRWLAGPRHQGDDSVAWWRARARSGALERGTAGR